MSTESTYSIKVRDNKTLQWSDVHNPFTYNGELSIQYLHLLRTNQLTEEPSRKRGLKTPLEYKLIKHTVTVEEVPGT